MPSLAKKQVGTLAQSTGQVEAWNAAAGAPVGRAIAAEYDRWAIELLKHAGGNNAHHADVPGRVALDDNIIRAGIESVLYGGDGIFHNAALDFLACPVADVERLGKSPRFGMVARQ